MNLTVKFLRINLVNGILKKSSERKFNYNNRLFIYDKHYSFTNCSPFKNQIKSIECVNQIKSIPCVKYSTDKRDENSKTEVKKPGLVQKFKQMYKDYWYVLVPVHMVTSAIWFGGFYYTVRSGVDVLAIVESLGVSDKLVAPLKDSSAGHLAFTFALYKIATPLRYASTIGGTTYSIKKLTSIGWIKPVPSKERIKEIIQEKKDNIQDRIKEGKIMYHSQVKEKQNQVMEEMQRYRTEMRNLKDKIKKM